MFVVRCKELTVSSCIERKTIMKNGTYTCDSIYISVNYVSRQKTLHLKYTGTEDCNMLTGAELR